MDSAVRERISTDEHRVLYPPPPLGKAEKTEYVEYYVGRVHAFSVCLTYSTYVATKLFRVGMHMLC